MKFRLEMHVKTIKLDIKLNILKTKIKIKMNTPLICEEHEENIIFLNLTQTEIINRLSCA